MKYYVALGGIACRTLKEYSNHNTNHKYYYIDTDPSTMAFLDKNDRFYVVSSLRYGTGAYRQIGRNSTKRDIYSGKLSYFFRDIQHAQSADITILSSSFGGFGSAAAVEILDLLEYMLFEKRGIAGEQHCRMIAVTETMIEKMGFPKNLLETFRINTLELLGDMASRMRASVSIPFVGEYEPLFNPECAFFLLDAERYDTSEIARFLDMSDVQLRQLDVQNRYTVKRKKSSPPVFISYSSKDQAVADLLLSALKEQNIESWIATKNIHEGSYAKQIIQGIRDAKVFVVLLSKNSISSEQVKNEIDRAFSRIGNGLKIVPFLIDESTLDDECAYYLCRQEFYFGRKPPIEERVRELAYKIADMLE